MTIALCLKIKAEKPKKNKGVYQSEKKIIYFHDHGFCR